VSGLADAISLAWWRQLRTALATALEGRGGPPIR
jgi:hypothetical protein